MVVCTAFEQADKMRTLLNLESPVPADTGGDPIWADIWSRLQPRHMAMWSWDKGVASARYYINHMLASARLADRFEQGGVVDDSLYNDIVR